MGAEAWTGLVSRGARWRPPIPGRRRLLGRAVAERSGASLPSGSQASAAAGWEPLLAAVNRFLITAPSLAEQVEAHCFFQVFRVLRKAQEACEERRRARGGGATGHPAGPTPRRRAPPPWEPPLHRARAAAAAAGLGPECPIYPGAPLCRALLPALLRINTHVSRQAGPAASLPSCSSCGLPGAHTAGLVS